MKGEAADNWWTKTWDNVENKLSLRDVVYCPCSLSSGIGTQPHKYEHAIGKLSTVKKKEILDHI